MRSPPGPPPPAGPPQVAPRPAQLGLATYYGDQFIGRRTASGERYDPRALTAAHLSLPLGAIVRVTRIDAAGRAVAEPIEVRVNDRGPYGGRGRIIDLSMAAARRLRMLESGVVRVRVEVIWSPARQRR